MPTLRDLLEPRGLKLIVGDDADYGRPVEGIHSTDHAHPGDWIEESWIVLTNGGGIRGRPALQRAMVGDLHRTGATALGFGVGIHFKRTPPALLEEARARGFPVFLVPLDVSFVDMIRDVYQATLDTDARSFIHLLAIQHHLIDALGEARPLKVILDRLAAYVDSAVAIVGPEGRVFQATGSVPPTVWDELQARRPMPVEFESDGHWSVAVPIFRSDNRAEKWLVATRRERFGEVRTIKRALQIAAPLIVAVATLRRAATAEERSLRAGLLKSILDCPDEATAATLASRAAVFGVTLRSPVRIVTLVVRDGDAATSAERVNAWLEERGRSFLCAVAGEQVMLLLQSPGADVDALVAALLETLDGDSIAGVGRPVTTIAEVAHSARDASTAVSQLKSTNGRRMLRYEQFDLDLALFSEVSMARIEPQLRDLLAPLDERADLWETLEVYFEKSLDAPSTARILHLHPNTLRYRLRRIEDLIGRPLRSPSTIAALEFALRARRASSG